MLAIPRNHSSGLLTVFGYRATKKIRKPFCVFVILLRMKSAKPLRQIVAANLRALMESRPDLDTQMKLAARAGLAQSTVGRMLHATAAATLDNVQAVAEAFGIPADRLVKDCEASNFYDDNDISGLSESGLQQIATFISFIREQEKLEAAPGLNFFNDNPPAAGTRAAIQRAINRPIDGESLSFDETAAPQQRANQPRERKK